MNAKSAATDIIVIGAGPAGLTFARQFKNSPLRVTIIEKNSRDNLAHPAFDGREIALTHFTQKFLERSGIWALIPDDKKYKLKEAKVENGTSDYELYFPQPTEARGKKISQLGFLVSNDDIRKACFEAIQDLNNVTLLDKTTVTDVRTTESNVTVELDNKETLTGQLLVCADGRFSAVRQKIGIPADTHQFGRSVICFRVSHPLSNEHTARECFHYGRTLAVLPLTEHLSSLVITIDSNRTREILELSDEELSSEMYRETKGRYGELTLVSKKCVYPLVGVHASRFYDERTALIGDSAVGMHPVTAHGFNLGVESVAILSKLILAAAGKGRDIGGETLLERYNLKHQAKTRVLYYGTNFIVNLFTAESAPARFLRTSILRLSNHLDPVKRLITKQLTG